MTTITPRFNVSDPGGAIRRGCVQIEKSSGNGVRGITGAIRDAVAYRVASLRRIKAPQDYGWLGVDELITLCAHGAEWDIREKAALELARRIGEAQ